MEKEKELDNKIEVEPFTEEMIEKNDGIILLDDTIELSSIIEEVKNESK